MYNKKTFQIFNNPKFSGEIKNPDAIGQVGNVRCGDVMKVFLKIDKKTKKIKDIKFQTYGCLPPQEKVNLRGKWKEISNLSESENVLNGNGNETTIKKIFKRDYHGDLLKFIPFVSPYNAFYVTPEHPILCIKRKRIKKTKKAYSKSAWLMVNHDELMSTKPDYTEAGNLETGDYLVFSYNKKVINKKEYTNSFLRLIGYYLSEGYVSAKGGAIGFAFNKKEKEYIEEVKKLIEDVVLKEAKSRVRANVEEVYVNSREFVRKILKEAGKLATKKRLSKEIMLLPPKRQLEIIETYLNGDGDLYFRRKGNTATYRLATSSESLAIQLQEILARNKIFASIRKRIQKESNIGGRIIRGGQELFIVSYKKDRKHKFVHPTRNYFLVPIKKIEKEKYGGKVYNFEVSSEPNSYLVRGFVVHNCIAAITASEIMCKLAKGKTLEQAMKINPEDIVKKLGEVPEIKFHCSILGTQALRKAIENYKEKVKD